MNALHFATRLADAALGSATFKITKRSRAQASLAALVILATTLSVHAEYVGLTVRSAGVHQVSGVDRQVWRVYAVFDDPGDFLTAVAGSPTHGTIVIQTRNASDTGSGGNFVNPPGGGPTAPDASVAGTQIEWDTFLDIGLSLVPLRGTDATGLAPGFTGIGNIAQLSTNNAGWFTTGGTPQGMAGNGTDLGAANWGVLLAQLTVNAGNNVRGTVNVGGINNNPLAGGTTFQTNSNGNGSTIYLSPQTFNSLVQDCNGHTVTTAWIGDGICDSGAYAYNGQYINLNCPQFGNDGGDCVAAPVLPEPDAHTPPIPAICNGQSENYCPNGFNLDSTKDYLVIVTHGWQPPEPPTLCSYVLPNPVNTTARMAQIADEIQQLVLSQPSLQPDRWQVLSIDWTAPATVCNPFRARENASAIGKYLGEAIHANSYQYVHFIAHSAGGRYRQVLCMRDHDQAAILWDLIPSVN